MSVKRKIPVGEHRLGAHFLELRETLSKNEYEKHLEKRLAFWVTPTDKRLPIALLGRKVGEILDMPLEELLRFPSIGEKKLNVLISLLLRVAGTPESALPQIESQVPAKTSTTTEKQESDHDGISLQNVSEFEWNNWQKVVIEQGLENELIGRLCSSLEEMPRVLWNKPLKTYTHISLDELRTMKTHGDRRIRAILRLFKDIFEVASKFNDVPRLRIRMSLRWSDETQRWLNEALQKKEFPPPEEVVAQFITPCLSQLRTDTSANVVQLAEARLGLHGPITSVRDVARQMHIARARVYQLLNQIAEIMHVRWGEGRVLVQRLRDKCIHEMINGETQNTHERFLAAAELFYPEGKTPGDPAAFPTVGSFADSVSPTFEAPRLPR